MILSGCRRSRFSREVLAPPAEPSFVQAVDAMAVAIASKKLAAYGDAHLNLATGVRLHVKTGDRVLADQSLATVYADSEAELEQAARAISAAISFSQAPVSLPPLILGRKD